MKRSGVLVTIAVVALALLTSPGAVATTPDHETNLFLDAATPVAPQSTIVVTGTLTDFGSPFPGAPVAIDWRCTDPYSAISGHQDVTTDANGQWLTEVTAGACSHYRFTADEMGAGTHVHAYAEAVVEVSRGVSTLVTTTPEQSFAGEPLTIVSTLTSGGAPVSGATVTLEAADPPAYDTHRQTAITDANGQASFQETPTTTGTHNYQTWFAGDDLLGWSDDWQQTLVGQHSTSVTISGPETAELDQPIMLTGGFTGRSGPVELTLTAPDKSTQTVTTAADGTYEVEVTPTLAHYRTWTIAYAGDVGYASSSATYGVSVPALNTLFSDLAPASVLWSPGGAYVLSGRLSGVPTGTTVSISGLPADGTATTDADGWFSLAVPVGYGAGTTHWTVSYGGDGRHDPAQAGHDVVVQPIERTLTATGPARVKVGAFCEISVWSSVAGGSVLVTDPDGNRWQQGTDETGHLAMPCDRTTAGLTTWTFATPESTGYSMASASVDVMVLRVPHPTITTDRFTYRAGDTARITIRPGGATGGIVRVTATRAGGSHVVLFSGSVPSSGMVLNRQVRFNEHLKVIAPADAEQAQATDETSYVTRLRLQTRVVDQPIAWDSRYAVFRSGAHPVFRTSSYPARPGRCESYWLYRVRHGEPFLVSQSPCLRQSDSGITRWQLRRNPPAGARFMLVTVSPGDSLNTSSSSLPIWFRFR